MKTIFNLFILALILVQFSCGPSKPDLSMWSFAGADSLKVEQVKSNTPGKLSLNVLGSIEDNRNWIIESLTNSGFAVATKVHELMDFTGKVDDYKLNLRIIDGQLDPFEALEEKDHFIKGKEGVKVSVYESMDKGNPTTIRLEKYTIDNTEELHNKAVALRQSLLFGKFGLTERIITNINDFEGETLEELKPFEPAFKLLERTLYLTINEDGTYEETFPFIGGEQVVIKGTWTMTENLTSITFSPSDLSGDNLLDSYFIKNEIDDEIPTTCKVLSFDKDGLEFITNKYKGAKVKSSFTKYNL